ncbi:Fc.00g091780.m01.CDS01 [Cosmosporella sp. VM-42]
MSTRDSVDVLMLLATNPAEYISRITFETSYGLVVEASGDGTLDIRLNNKCIVPHTTTADPPEYSKPGPVGLGYQYYFWPSYQTSCVFYTLDWKCNPKDHEGQVMFSELKASYSDAWCAAHKAWVDELNRAFIVEGRNGPDSKSEPFIDPKIAAKWFLKGVLLGCWLALQPSVDSVICEAGEQRVYLEKDNLASILRKYLATIQNLV